MNQIKNKKEPKKDEFESSESENNLEESQYNIVLKAKNTPVFMNQDLNKKRSEALNQNNTF